MAKYKCPCCGSPYDGKRCRECCYEPFTEEIAHGGHYHEGEPLVVKERPSRPAGYPAADRRRDPYPGRRKENLPKWLWVVLAVCIVLALPNVLFGVLASVLRGELSEVSGSYAAEPSMPSDGTVLYNENGILLMADWRDGDPFDDSILVYLHNGTRQDIAVSGELMSVNGYMSPGSFLYCEAEAGQTGDGVLWLDGDDLKDAGIETAAKITFLLDIFDTNHYDTVATSGFITLRTGAPEEPAASPYADGTILYAQDGVTFVYTGCVGEDCQDGALQFYAENTTDRCLQLSIDQPTVNGEDAELFLWQELAPRTRAIIYVELYPLEELGVDAPEEIRSVEFILDISDRDDWDYWFQSEPLQVAP